MYPWLIIFITGWFGTYWWPGIEVDAPKPGGDPQPWWTRWVLGAIGGAAAILVARVTAVPAEALAGLLVSLAAGRVAAGIVAPAFRAIR